MKNNEILMSLKPVQKYTRQRRVFLQTKIDTFVCWVQKKRVLIE